MAGKREQTINRFDSGMVEGPNPRDISDEASVSMEGFDPTTIGGLRAIGGYVTTTIPDFPKLFCNLFNQPGDNTATGYGYGIFQFSSDYPNLPLYNGEILDANGSLPTVQNLGASANNAYDASSVTETEETLYTIAIGTHTALGLENASTPGELLPLLFVHWYSLYDAGSTHNDWYVVGWDKMVGAYAEIAEAPTSGLTSMTLASTSLVEGDSIWDNVYAEPDKQYLPKFFLVNGYPRIYCGNQSGFPIHFMGYIRNGFSANIASDANTYGVANRLEADGQQDTCWQVNQWHIAPNILQAPTVRVFDDSTTFTGNHNRVCVSMQRGITAMSHIRDSFVGLQGSFGFACQWKEDTSAGWLSTGGPMKLYFSFVYDGTQEGPMTDVDVLYPPGDSIFGANANQRHDCYLEIEALTSCSNDATVSSVDYSNLNSYPGPRCTGWKVYYSYTGGSDDDDDSTEDANIYLLFESDWEKGYRLAGNQHWNTFGPQQYFRHKFMDPPQFEDFLTENGYFPGQDINALYSTAVYTKQRVFIGNVTKKGVRYPDRIMKSPVGKPDIFPDENFIDITGSDGDEVVHLEVFGNELLVFKRRTLYVVDITNMDEETLKSTKPGMGVTSHNHVTHTPHGVVFANPGGVWLYEGGETGFSNLLEEEGVDKISAETWRAETNWNTDVNSSGKLDIEYSQENDKLIVIVDILPDQDTSGDVYVYHFRTKAWAIARNGMPQGSNTAGNHYCTQMIRDYNNKILIAGRDGSSAYDDAAATGSNLVSSNTADGTTYELKMFSWDEALHGDTGLIDTGALKWTSKDFDFGNLGAKKSVVKMYITYKIAQRDSLAYSNIYLQYSVDGRTDLLKNFSSNSKFNDKYGNENGYTNTDNGGLKHTEVSGEGVYRTLELLPDDKKECKKINSFQIHITNPGTGGDGKVTKKHLNIDDFTIIYKEHTTK